MGVLYASGVFMSFTVNRVCEIMEFQTHASFPIRPTRGHQHRHKGLDRLRKRSGESDPSRSTFSVTTRVSARYSISLEALHGYAQRVNQLYRCVAIYVSPVLAQSPRVIVIIIHGAYA